MNSKGVAILRYSWPVIIVCGLWWFADEFGSTSSQTEQTGSPESSAMPRMVPPTEISEQTIEMDDGSILRFTIAVPQSYVSEVPTPLIVALHYGGEVTPFYGRGILELLVAPALGELNAIIIAPDSIAGRWTNPRNAAALGDLLDYVAANYNIDESQTLLTGFSMGGQGTWHLAGRYEDRFSAAIPIAARPGQKTDWRIPIYVIHSRADEVVPLGPAQEYVERLKSAGCDVQLVVIDGVTHFETHRFVEPLRGAVPWIKKAWK